MKNTLISLRFLGVFTLLLGILYPLTMTGLGQLLFPFQANGSLLREGDKIVGSSLLGQDFSSSDLWFQGRPSATSPAYNPSASGASNLSPWGEAFRTQAAGRADNWKAKVPGVPVPQELVTASASGLDPHISLKTALYQVPVVAKARYITDSSTLENLVRLHASGEIINVLELNRDLEPLAKVNEDAFSEAKNDAKPRSLHRVNEELSEFFTH